MPWERFTSQASIFSFAATMCQWAQVHLRTAILQNDDRWIAYAISALRFPFKHATTNDLTPTLYLAKVHRLIASYFLTRDKRKLMEAIEELNYAKRSFLWLAQSHLYQKQPPTKGDMPSWTERIFTNLERAIDENMPWIAAAWTALAIIIPLAKAQKLLQLGKGSVYLYQTVEAMWAEIQGPLWRKAPEYARRLWEAIKIIRKIKP